MLYNDDCLSVLKDMADSSIDLIYLDPPFYTQKKQTACNSTGKIYSFSDSWASREDYLSYIKIRLIEMKRVLKSTGNIFLHCNTASSHHLRILLDEIFGENNFRSEIIWTYKRWSNTRKGLLPNHQTIFFYSKTNQYKFNTFYESYSPTTNIDQILQDRERNVYGKTVYKRDAGGNTIPAKEKKGVPVSDVWEIPFLNPKAKERTGYPTQKPIELMDRIIKIASDEGDIVLDPFCGSGSTLVSAKLLNRSYMGIDLNPDAISLSQERLSAPFKTTSNVLKEGIHAYEKKTEYELSILNQFDCNIVRRNKGIDAFLRKYYAGKPVAIKIQKQNESIEDAIHLLDTAGRKKGCIFTVLIANNRYFSSQIVPNNMIVIPQYNKQLEHFIERFFPLPENLPAPFDGHDFVGYN